MFFDKKIKAITEALGTQQTIGGYKAQSRKLDMTEDQFKTALVEFNKSFNPQILLDALTFSEMGSFKDENGENKKVDNIHIKFPFKNGSPKWIGAKELKDAFKIKYFTKGSKDYIDFPVNDQGQVLDNRSFQTAVKRDPVKYAKLQTLPVVWLNIIQQFFPMEASDIRQEVDTDQNTFWYLTKTPHKIDGEIQWVGPLKLKQGRIKIRPDGTISKTPFGGQQTYKWKYQAYTNKGVAIPYKEIAGGISFDQFKKVLHSDQAKKAAGVGV
jgi:hypothetical protein